ARVAAAVVAHGFMLAKVAGRDRQTGHIPLGSRIGCAVGATALYRALTLQASFSTWGSQVVAVQTAKRKLAAKALSPASLAGNGTSRPAWVSSSLAASPPACLAFGTSTPAGAVTARTIGNSLFTW